MGKLILRYSRLTIILLMFSMLVACGYYGDVTSKRELRITDIEIFKGSPVWELAKHVKSGNVEEIQAFLNEQPDQVDYQEPKYGATLLMWSVGMEKYDSAEALLNNGADPDIPLSEYGETPLMTASSYSWFDMSFNDDPKFVELLLEYEADPDIQYIGISDDGVKSVVEPGTTAVIHSIGRGIEKTKALVGAGADLTLTTDSGRGVVVRSLQDKDHIEYAYYFIVEHRLDVTRPYQTRFNYSNTESKKDLHPVDLLRDWLFDLDSKEYHLKMEIVDEFTRQGVNYRDTSIHSNIIEKIKKLYPNTWSEYLKKY